MSRERLDPSVDFVEVEAEPKHPEQFRNERVRVYVCTIPPGECTLFHRHTMDTVYIVLSGGTLRTKNAPNRGRSPTTFPRSFPIPARARLGIQTVFGGVSTLKPPRYFITLSGRREAIHRVSASRRNAGDVRLLGIELRHGIDAGGKSLELARPFKKECVVGSFSIFRLALRPGESTGELSLSRPALFVCVAGSAEIAQTPGSIEAGDSSISKTLTPETTLWVGAAEALAITSRGDAALDLIAIG